MSITAYRLCTSVILLTNLVISSKIQAQVKTPAAILTPVSEQQLGTLRGNIHPLARAEFDQGLAPSDLPMERMLLTLKRSERQEAGLLKLLDEQQQNGSPNYHRWLTPEQFGEEFGAADSDIVKVKLWLESHGLTVNSVSAGKTSIEFSGTAGLVENAFHTSMHKYAVGGREHLANSSEPRIPAALMPVVAGIPSLHNFFSTPQVLRSESDVAIAALTAKAQPSATSGSLHHLSPSDFAVIYNTNPLLQAGVTGAGTTIAVVGRSNIIVQDVVSFRSLFGLPANTPTVIVNGKNPGNLGGVEEVEAVLDTSWSGAVAPGANVNLVVSASTGTTDGVTLSEQYVVDHNLAGIMTESFHDCEGNYTSSQAAAVANLAKQAAAQGITYLVATGDAGSADCDAVGGGRVTGPLSVNVLASTPYTIAVGGTQFNEGASTAFWSATDSSTYGSALSYIPEDVWNYNCVGNICNPTGLILGGGGGASIFFAKPAWQTGVPGIPDDGRRDIPDVSLTASNHDGYLICVEASCSPRASGIAFNAVYGTSASAPAFAGIMALVTQKAGGARLGLANPILYRLAAAQKWASCDSSNTPLLPPANCVFHDVTVGTNSMPGQSNYGAAGETYPATLGYDLGTGLGSVNATALVMAWTGNIITIVPTPPFQVTPASGSGAKQAFTFVFSNSAGAGNIAQSHMLITGNGSGANACYLIYQASNNGLYLAGDTGSSVTGPITPGGSGTLSNSQCSVAGSSVSVNPSGNTLTIAETTTFAGGFAGAKSTMMYTFNQANVGSGWSTVGSWTIPAATITSPFSVSPSSGSGAKQTFTYTFTNPAGASAIWQGHMLITGTGTGANACYLIYQSSNQALYLTSDIGFSLIGPVTPGGSGTLSNSQCSVPASTVSVDSSGSTVKVTGAVTFKSSFTGPKTNMMYTFDTSHAGSGWFNVGSWTP